MTQTAMRPATTPLTNPVPGMWMKPGNDGPAVYVPHEKVEEEFTDSAGNKHKRVRFEQNTHIKRMVSEGWMPAQAPDAVADVATEKDTLAALQAEVERLRAELAAKGESAPAAESGTPAKRGK